jgi:hypothetical protein
MRTFVLLLAFASCCPADDVAGWPEVIVPMDGTPAYERFWTAANGSSSEWYVALEGGRVTASAREWKRTGPPGIPVGGAEVPATLRLVRPAIAYVRVPDGWLVSYNGGEFGGVVLWYSADGKTNREVSGDRVNAFVETKDGVFAATGLSHGGADFGALVRFTRKDGQWTADKVVELRGCGYAAATQADGKIIVAEGGRVVGLNRDGTWELEGERLLRVDRDGKVETLVAGGEWVRQFPNSMAVGPDGRVWVGMRRFVGVFDPKDSARGVRLRGPSKKFLPTKGS